MELAVAGSIAALGYFFSSSSKEESTSSDKKPTPVPRSTNARPGTVIEPDPEKTTLLSEARKMEEEAAEKKWKEAQDPQSTNVIHSQRLYPFFRSARTQNLNESILDRKRDLYMGNESTYMKKQESGARFKALPQQIDSSGSQGNGMCPRRMPVPSMIQNNVLPTEQIRVGPGVGIPSGETTGNDGFHPRLRVMPSNANVYRRNQLQSRIHAGKALNGVRGVDPVVRNNNPPRVYDMNRYPLEKGKATINAAIQRPMVNTECVKRVHEKDYTGPAQGRGGHQVENAQNTRVRDDDNTGFDQSNVTAASTKGTGAYSHYTYDDSKILNQNREQSNLSNLTNVRGSIAPTAPVGVIMNEGSLRDPGGTRFGIAGHYNEQGMTRAPTQAKPTLRELTSEKTMTGPALSSVKAATQQCTYKQLNKPAKRPLVDGYWANPERPDALRRTMMPADKLSSVCVGRTQYRVRDRSHVQQNIVTSHPTQPTYHNIAPVGSLTNGHNKLPERNVRSDFGLLDHQMKSNPYAIHH